MRANLWEAALSEANLCHAHLHLAILCQMSLDYALHRYTSGRKQ